MGELYCGVERKLQGCFSNTGSRICWGYPCGPLIILWAPAPGQVNRAARSEEPCEETEHWGGAWEKGWGSPWEGVSLKGPGKSPTFISNLVVQKFICNSSGGSCLLCYKNDLKWLTNMLIWASRRGAMLTVRGRLAPCACAVATLRNSGLAPAPTSSPQSKLLKARHWLSFSYSVLPQNNRTCKVI